jgi:hypothetical protein
LEKKKELDFIVIFFLIAHVLLSWFSKKNFFTDQVFVHSQFEFFVLIESPKNTTHAQMASLLKKLSKGSAAHSAQATGKPGKSTGQTVNALHRAPSLSQAPKSGGWSSASASATATGPAAAMASSFSAAAFGAAVRPAPPSATAAAASGPRGHGPAASIPGGLPPPLPVMYPTALQQILDCNGGSNEETTRKHQEKHVENWIEWYGGRCECVGRMS